VAPGPDFTNPGALAALAAGLPGTTGTTTIAAAEPPSPAGLPVLPTVVTEADLAAESRRLVARVLAAQRARVEAEDRLADAIGPDAYELVRQHIEGPVSVQQELWVDLVLAEVARYLPGMAPALRVVVHHVYQGILADCGVCCASGSLIS
jgi:hypothetical protein